MFNKKKKDDKKDDKLEFKEEYAGKRPLDQNALVTRMVPEYKQEDTTNMVRNLVKEAEAKKQLDFPEVPKETVGMADSEQPTIKVITYEEAIMNNIALLSRQQAEMYDYMKRLGKSVGFEEKE